jgi:hypothetical protein
MTTPALPTPTAGSEYLYMIYIPHTVPLDPTTLGGALGYHTDTTTTTNVHFAYAVILDDGSGADTTTSTAAHELIEAATDPYSAPMNGWYADPPTNDPWYYVQGEIADLCDGEALIRSGTFAVQRTWSNNAVMADASPCIPYDPDDVWMDVSADPVTMPTIPAGGTATFTLTGWSTTPVADWQLSTYNADFSDLDTTATRPAFNGGNATAMINNGTTAMLTMRAPATAKSGQVGAVYVLSGRQLRPWVVGFSVQ